MSDDITGFYVNSRTISFVIGVISLLSSMVYGITTFNNYAYKIDQFEKQVIELKSDINQQQIQLNEQNRKIQELSLTVAKLEERISK